MPGGIKHGRRIALVSIVCVLCVVAVGCGGEATIDDAPPAQTSSAQDGSNVAAPPGPPASAQSGDRSGGDQSVQAGGSESSVTVPTPGSTPGSAGVAPTIDGVLPSTTSVKRVPDVAPPYKAPTKTEDLVPAKIGLPAQLQLNEAGDPIELDDTALLACAHVQFAWVGLLSDDANTARTEVVAAALRAEVSAVVEIAALAPTLRTAFDAASPIAVVEAALRVCTDRGFAV